MTHKVICEHAGFCDHYCGGAIPHIRCTECGKCPRRSQNCVIYIEEEWDIRIFDNKEVYIPKRTKNEN